jgi:predicted DNA-binding ribbon-helix-helix protein
VTADPPTFGRPLKRSVTIAGHETSVSLEPVYWQALERAAAAREVTLSALIAEVDRSRVDTRPMPNLTSALRQWLLRDALADRGGE